MPAEIGFIEALFRYPVKSMAGHSLQTATLGWHGIEGDRRLGLRRMDDRSGFPWLSASRLPELVLYNPSAFDATASPQIPATIQTPEGEEWPVFSEQLASSLSDRFGAPLQMMQWKHGIFDEATISVIATGTIEEISTAAGVPSDARRFRPNVLVRLHGPGAFQEDDWVGGTLSFGDDRDAPAVAITLRDLRCAMLNIHPLTAKLATEVMKTVVRMNDNHAGVYAAVTRTGTLAVGQPIYFHPAGSTMA